MKSIIHFEDQEFDLTPSNEFSPDKLFNPYEKYLVSGGASGLRTDQISKDKTDILGLSFKGVCGVVCGSPPKDGQPITIRIHGRKEPIEVVAKRSAKWPRLDEQFSDWLAAPDKASRAMMYMGESYGFIFDARCISSITIEVPAFP